MNYDLVARTFGDRAKEHNGDAMTHAVIAEGSALLAMVADGVGSRPCDWLASEMACKRAVEIAKSEPGFIQEPAESLACLVVRIDRDIRLTTGRGRGMMCAAVIAVWLFEADTVWFANVGDTRFHHFVDPQLFQLSEDDSKAVVRRGQDGRPLLAGGAAVVQRGITNALGSGYAHAEVRSIAFQAGEAFILSSDGFYGASTEFEGDLIRVLSHGDLEDAVIGLARGYEERARDDASVLVVRSGFRALDEGELRGAVERGERGSIPRHALASAIADRLEALVSAGEVVALTTFINYLERDHILLGKRRLDGLLKLMGERRWGDRHTFNALVNMLRRQV